MAIDPVDARHLRAGNDEKFRPSLPVDVHKHIDVALGLRIRGMSVYEPKLGSFSIGFDLNRPCPAAALIGYQKVGAECAP